MIGIPLGLLYANAGEWLIHKYVLHGLGRKKTSFWAFHWHEHHKACRKHDHVDAAYEQSLWGWHAQSKEAAALGLAALSVLPVAPIAPFFAGAVVYSVINYYRKHKRAHLDPDWARQHLPWHYDHHMGPDQHKNWCVTRPWFDQIMGTREAYVGTERERLDRAKRVAKAARAANARATTGAAPVAAIPAAG